MVEQWVTEARDAYLDQCRELREMQRSGLVLRTATATMPAGAQLGKPTGVTVSAGATEIFPRRSRWRSGCAPYGSADDAVFNLTCAVSLEDPQTGEAQELGAAIRDELIALEHAARHTN